MTWKPFTSRNKERCSQWSRLTGGKAASAAMCVCVKIERPRSDWRSKFVCQMFSDWELFESKGVQIKRHHCICKGLKENAFLIKCRKEREREKNWTHSNFKIERSTQRNKVLTSLPLQSSPASPIQAAIIKVTFKSSHWSKSVRLLADQSHIPLLHSLLHHLAIGTVVTVLFAVWLVVSKVLSEGQMAAPGKKIPQVLVWLLLLFPYCS